MSEKIIVGPLLGFEDGDFYSVCILIEPGVTPVLELTSRSETHPFTRAASVGKYEFWRAEFPLAASAAGVRVDYSVKVNGTAMEDQHARNAWRFHVPGNSEQPLIAYGSCNGFSSAKLARDTDDGYALWKRMEETHHGRPERDGEPELKPRPFSLLLLGGDQVYADEIWESKRCPNLQRWCELSWKRQHKAKVSTALSDEIASFYDWLYTVRWQDENMSLMLASIPSVMMWDDHDIFDGWGSYPGERQECPVFQEVFTHASRVFELFQLRSSSRNRLHPGNDHRSLRLRFRDYWLLVLDNRSERRMDRIMSEEHWQDLKNWLSGLADHKVSNLLVMSAVPVVYRSFAAVEAIMDFTPWREELEDDVHDHWSSKSHEAERMRLIMVLLNFLDDHHVEKCRGILLSGDVHVGAIGQIWDEPRSVGLTQVISSGIVHPPPSAFAWAGIQLMTSDDPERLGDGDVTTEMLTPFGSSRYLRTRNFATLQTGTDSKTWVNWICEDEKLTPSFAIG